MAPGPRGNLGAEWVHRVRPQQLCSHKGKCTVFPDSPSWDDPSEITAPWGKPSPETAAAVEAEAHPQGLSIPWCERGSLLLSSNLPS